MSGVRNTRDIIRKIRLETHSLGEHPIAIDFVRDLFSNINQILLLEQTEYKRVHIQFRILEVKEMLHFLSSLPFDTEKQQKILNQHLSLCLNYHSETDVQESLTALHLRILKLPSICPDYFGLAIARIRETIPFSNLTKEEEQNFDQLFSYLLPPPLLLQEQSYDLRYQNISTAREKVQHSCEVCTRSASTKLNSLVPQLNSILLCYDDILEMLERNPSVTIEVKAKLSGVGLGFFDIDMAVAFRLLGCTPTGGLYKSITQGTHAVCHCEGVFYKPNSESACISPEREFAIYSLYYNLLQIDAIAPVALVKVQNVIFNIQNEGNVFKNSQHAGVSQASLGVDGILLQDVIAMTEIPGFLRKRIGNLNAELLFDMLLNQHVDARKLLLQWKDIDFDALEEMNITEKAKVLMSLYEETLINFAPEKRPSGHNTLHDFCLNIDASKTCQYFLEALWVIKHCPDICVCKPDEFHFGELSNICKYSHKIKELFPKLNTKDTMIELDSLMSKFDEENFSAHFLVTMLTNPCDHKADNLMIIFDWTEDGKIQKAKIIGIDNDLAFGVEGCTKTFVYLLQNMDNSFHNSILQRIIQLTPEGFILDWLITLEEQNNHYKDYIAQKVLTKEDFLKGGDIILDIPLKLDTSIIPNIYKKLKKLLDVLEGTNGVSHWDILFHIQPGVADAYKKASNSSEQLEKSFQLITEAFVGYKDIECLSNRKESPAELALAFTKSIDISAFDDEMQVHFLGKVLRFFPAQSNILKIPGEACDVHSRCNFFLLAVKNGYCALVARLLEEEKMEALQENRESKENQFTLLEQKDQEKKTAFLIASAYADTDMMKLLLFYNCNTLAKDKNGKSCIILLIYFLLQNEKNASAAIRLLGEYPDIPWNAGCENMINPLHLLVILYPQIPGGVMPFFAFLMNKGASPDLVDVNGLSPLDCAMEKNFVEVVQVLIEHGAGRVLNVAIATNFFSRNSCMQELYNELTQRSLLLRWNLALQCLQTNSSISGVCLQGTELEKIFLSPDLMTKLFKKGNIRNNCKFGRRNVHNIKIEGKDAGTSYELYFKQNPELPGIEFAVDILFEILIGHGTSYTDLVKVTHPLGGKSYPILISQGIQGENLCEVLKHKPYLLEKLNDQHFSELLLASLLVNFEDAKPDNFILEELPDKSFRIVGIDNDHAFIPPICKKDGKTLLVKCILYCMDCMRFPIHPNAREKFLSLDAETILSLWLNRLAKKQNEYLELFPISTKKKSNKADSTVLSIPFQKGTIVEIYQKFVRIQNCLL